MAGATRLEAELARRHHLSDSVFGSAHTVFYSRADESPRKAATRSLSSLYAPIRRLFSRALSTSRRSCPLRVGRRLVIRSKESSTAQGVLAMTACVVCREASTAQSSGTRYESVLPEPVCACTTQSSPSRRKGSAAAYLDTSVHTFHIRFTPRVAPGVWPAPRSAFRIRRCPKRSPRQRARPARSKSVPAHRISTPEAGVPAFPKQTHNLPHRSPIVVSSPKEEKTTCWSLSCSQGQRRAPSFKPRPIRARDAGRRRGRRRRRSHYIRFVAALVPLGAAAAWAPVERRPLRAHR